MYCAERSEPKVSGSISTASIYGKTGLRHVEAEEPLLSLRPTRPHTASPPPGKAVPTLQTETENKATEAADNGNPKHEPGNCLRWQKHTKY